MTDEEKKAIDILKNEIADIVLGEFCDKCGDTFCNCRNEECYYTQAIDVILNLVDKQQNKIASKEKQIKLMQSCDLAKVIKEQEEKIQSLESQLDFIGEQNKYINKLEKEHYKQQKEIEVLKEHNEELAKFILNSGIEIIKSDKKDMIIDRDNYAKFKIE